VKELVRVTHRTVEVELSQPRGASSFSCESAPREPRMMAPDVKRVDRKLYHDNPISSSPLHTAVGVRSARMTHRTTHNNTYLLSCQTVSPHAAVRMYIGTVAARRKRPHLRVNRPPELLARSRRLIPPNATSATAISLCCPPNKRVEGPRLDEYTPDCSRSSRINRSQSASRRFPPHTGEGVVQRARLFALMFARA
jgi:hypothetical protein